MIYKYLLANFMPFNTVYLKGLHNAWQLDNQMKNVFAEVEFIQTTD